MEEAVSYDLFLKPRTGNVTPEAFSDYFRLRRNYKVNLPQAWYENEDTGVYFVFELSSEINQNGGRSYPITLSINYLRPSFFGLEAEPEVSAFVRAFDATVSDPQTNGMGEGEYHSDLF